MQPSSSCASVLIAIGFVIGLLLLGISAAVQPPSNEPIMAQTADAIRATNAQIEIFLTQTEQARVSTFTPTSTPTATPAN